MPDGLLPISFPPELLKSTDGEISSSEEWWRDHQEWLAQKGYMLRSRYRPGWKPSWQTSPKLAGRRFNVEDGTLQIHPFILDAVRTSDSDIVVLKKVLKSDHEFEVEISTYLSSEPLRQDPQNHCAPILEVLEVPEETGTHIIVMPLLRLCNDPHWSTFGEVIAFLIQIFEGMQFMHRHHIAHRDAMLLNIMYDPRPMFPRLYHPVATRKRRDFKGSAKYTTRTMTPVKYYFIDFGLSRRYNPEEGSPREHPILGGDKSVPELQNWNGELLDPFPADIYYLGNMIRTWILQKYRGVGFLKTLVDNMTQTDISKRPSIDDAKAQLDTIIKSLGPTVFRLRLIPLDESPEMTGLMNFLHKFDTLRYKLYRRPAIPLPS